LSNPSRPSLPSGRQVFLKGGRGGTNIKEVMKIFFGFKKILVTGRDEE
jgi:hypothetical protein